MRGIALVFCGLIAISGVAQNRILQTEELTLTSTNEGFSGFISSIQSKKSRDLKLVRSIFTKAHQDFLKTYRAYSQVKDIFEKGNYDCLSGTYFLTRAFDQLGIEYKIFETNYHIFLVVQTQRGEVLLESTDRVNGFITDKETIKEKIAYYQQAKASSPGTELYLSRLRMFHELRPDQLPGLLYFNRSIEAFHANDLVASCSNLEKAWEIYNNPRIEAFTPILIHTIANSTLDSDAKAKLTDLLQTHQQSASYSLVSR
ncbi:hypothetical protein WSM22_14380 [Cytophagales bacterium WSM2-2]|nr:hypothetical protein WSM22_14380 [Cytophagales bacterium WSM2-2]